MQPNIVTTTLPVACFCPPLSDKKIAEYGVLVSGLSEGEVKDAMSECLEAIKAWWELPESSQKGSEFAIRHKGKDTTFSVTPLEAEHVASLNRLIPWPYELDAMQKVFDAIPVEEKDLRNAAFTLLWYARELCLDREPLTQERLPS